MRTINPELERYIFEELGAYYKQTPFEVSCNLNNDNNKTKGYLGTYFPRSYIEAYSIFSNLFMNPLIVNSLLENESIEILDIGSGTGGNLFGLLGALNECFSKTKVNVYSIDGNGIALEYQTKMLTDFYDFNNYNDNEITLRTCNIMVENKSTLFKKINEQCSKNKFNIITSFKFISEFYNQNPKSNKGTYKEMLKVGEQLLQSNGFMIIEDITNTVGNYELNSVIMSKECKEYFSSHRSELVYILPKSCSLWHSECMCSRCFSKIEYTLSHRQSRRDTSKITFRLFAKKPLGLLLYSDIINEGVKCYKISDKNYCAKSEYYYDQDKPPQEKCLDAFTL